MQSISEIVLDNDLFVVSDEIYDKLVYGCEAVSITSLGKEIRDRTILVNGVSKTYSMTGWRIGYAVGNKDVITAMSDLQSHTTSNPTSIAQKAALAALTLPELDEEVSQMVSEFSRRRDFLVEALQKIPGVKCMCPHGAFYVFPDISELYGKAYDGKVIDSSNTFADLLLSVARVAVVPGSGFGADEHIRLSYATSPETIKTGVERMAEFISHLS
jgi:aspartate aminotransferase